RGRHRRRQPDRDQVAGRRQARQLPERPPADRCRFPGPALLVAGGAGRRSPAAEQRAGGGAPRSLRPRGPDPQPGGGRGGPRRGVHQPHLPPRTDDEGDGLMSVASVPMDVAPAPRMLFMQTRSLLVGYFRIPAFSATSLALPLMFWLFFGL